jgi:benzodiazapine receptor
MSFCEIPTMNTPTPAQSILGLIAWLGITFLAPVVGMDAQPGAWYAGLNKPAFNPPSWIFGPVWTLLYTLMALAAWMVWRRGGLAAQRIPLTFYGIQLVLNAIWSPVFFTLHRLDLAFVIIVVLWFFIFHTLRAFWRVHRLSGLFFVPYLAWVSFAAVLNFTIWRLNP